MEVSVTGVILPNLSRSSKTADRVVSRMGTMSEPTRTEARSTTDDETPAERYRRLSAAMAATVAAVPPDRWDDPSPCADWTARDVLQHVIDATTWQATQVDLELAGGSAADDPVAAWETTRLAVLEVLDDPDLAGREYDGMFGRTTIAETYRSFYCFDLVVHRWDIAHATGVDATISAVDLAIVRELSEAMGDLIRMDGVAGPEVAVPADADEQTKLLGYLGRTV